MAIMLCRWTQRSDAELLLEADAWIGKVGRRTPLRHTHVHLISDFLKADDRAAFIRRHEEAARVALEAEAHGEPVMHPDREYAALKASDLAASLV